MAGLEDSKLFSSLSTAELQLLENSSELREIPANHQIFREGDAGDGIYVVAEGIVQISAPVGPDERRILSRVRPGEFFGEMAVLDSEPRSASATTEVPSKVIFIPRESLLKMIETSPRLAVSLVREFSLRMRDFNRQYIQEVIQAERLTIVGRFARTIVHDFKNPLNIIGLAAELTTMEKVSPEMRKSATVRIRKQVDRLNNMISELLEFTRGAKGPVMLAPANYAEYVRNLVEEMSAELHDKNVTLTLREEPPDVMIPLDQKRMNHVFANLFHNAVDATGPDGRIFISFEEKPHEIITHVEDTGPGIAPEILPSLFDAFATYGKAKGSGLGLSICKRVIEDHRGWITAGNRVGSGAIFSFGLPRE